MSQKNLTSVPKGESAGLAGLAFEAAVAKRLADIGFLPGRSIQMVRTGDPCVVRMSCDTSVGLGRQAQQGLMLEDRGGAVPVQR